MKHTILFLFLFILLLGCKKSLNNDCLLIGYWQTNYISCCNGSGPNEFHEPILSSGWSRCYCLSDVSICQGNITYDCWIIEFEEDRGFNWTLPGEGRPIDYYGWTGDCSNMNSIDIHLENHYIPFLDNDLFNEKIDAIVDVFPISVTENNLVLRIYQEEIGDQANNFIRCDMFLTKMPAP